MQVLHSMEEACRSCGIRHGHNDGAPESHNPYVGLYIDTIRAQDAI